MSKRDALLSCADGFGKRLSEDTVRIWMEDLEEFPQFVVEEAFKNARRSFQRFPTVAGIRDLCGAEVADARRKETAGMWLPPLQYSIEEKRRFLEHCASGQRKLPVPKALQHNAAHRKAWDESIDNARHALATMTDDELERSTMPGLLRRVMPGWDDVGRMP